jgi:hypothetical protein
MDAPMIMTRNIGDQKKFKCSCGHEFLYIPNWKNSIPAQTLSGCTAICPGCGVEWDGTIVESFDQQQVKCFLFLARCPIDCKCGSNELKTCGVAEATNLEEAMLMARVGLPHMNFSELQIKEISREYMETTMKESGKGKATEERHFLMITNSGVQQISVRK